ncbi:MAG: HXXEE domain-containing protein, partial [Bacteroidales bacterium]|nr:HXXEE domain-containing protein [Bacteroidales bacterium]
DQQMNALSILYLVLPLPLVFILHDTEEAIVQHRWMLAHREDLTMRFPNLRPVIEHLSNIGTKAFVVAAMEELIVLIIATCHVLIGGTYSTQIWSALFLAFSLHLFVHLVQAILFRGYVPGVLTSLIFMPYAIYGLWSIWLTTTVVDFLLMALCGILFMIANLKFAHWLGMKI